MPQVHSVEHAQKDYPEAGIVKGDQYYWFKQKIMSGGRWFSRMTRTKSYPKASQLTQSDYVRSVLELQENYDFSGVDSFDELNSQLNSLIDEVGELKSNQEEKLENMPESLRESSSGETIQARIDNLDEVVTELESVDVRDDSEFKVDVEGDGDETEVEISTSELETALSEARDSILDIINGIEA